MKTKCCDCYDDIEDESTILILDPYVKITKRCKKCRNKKKGKLDYFGL